MNYVYYTQLWIGGTQHLVIWLAPPASVLPYWLVAWVAHPASVLVQRPVVWVAPLACVLLQQLVAPLTSVLPEWLAVWNAHWASSFLQRLAVWLLSHFSSLRFMLLVRLLTFFNRRQLELFLQILSSVNSWRCVLLLQILCDIFQVVLRREAQMVGVEEVPGGRRAVHGIWAKYWSWAGRDWWGLCFTHIVCQKKRQYSNTRHVHLLSPNWACLLAFNLNQVGLQFMSVLNVITYYTPMMYYKPTPLFSTEFLHV